uniref:DUF4283 domain-containing protein n=1 Tax=Tanacetum cinerariifolium TaxID=118510 RepID=A0A6L2KQJ6_TANCI|nr:hypothetical protein [Tanacetum cinerariifolium]
MNRRSLKRQQKIPTHFNDYVHDLNMKKDTNKNKGTNGVDVVVDKLKLGLINDEMLARNERSRNLRSPSVSDTKPTVNADIVMSYASVANNVENLIENKLMTVPTDIAELVMNLWMWSRYGLKEVIENDCGMLFFKFHHEKGMNYVVDNGPWMVNNKPLVVKKWHISMNFKRTEPEKLPLWVRLCNPPLEALTIKGITALAKCCKGNTGKKTVKVMYDWAPHVCSECGVFGHNIKMCPKSAEADKNDQPEVASKHQPSKNVANRGGVNKLKTIYPPKQHTNNGNDKMKGTNSNIINENHVAQDEIENVYDKTPKKGSGRKDKFENSAAKKGDWSVNKYYVLENLDEEGELNEMEGMANKEKVDAFINMKKQPTMKESAD